MRLLHVETLKLSEYNSSEIPEYAILSHRWGDEEVTYEEIDSKHDASRGKLGYRKITEFSKFVKKHWSHIKWIWIDTCCINKQNNTELSEAINSMYKWYRRAAICIAYLADVKKHDDLNEFRRSGWFRRGWTLQELLAPRTVVFLTQSWEVIGHKGEIECSKSTVDLIPSLVVATQIPESVLIDVAMSERFGIDERLKWVAGRETTREEDMAY